MYDMHNQGVITGGIEVLASRRVPNEKLGTLQLIFTSPDDPEPFHDLELSTVVGIISPNGQRLIKSGYLVQRLSNGKICDTEL